LNYFPGLASNRNPPDLCLLSSWDYSHESQPYPSKNSLKMIMWLKPLICQVLDGQCRGATQVGFPRMAASREAGGCESLGRFPRALETQRGMGSSERARTLWRWPSYFLHCSLFTCECNRHIIARIRGCEWYCDTVYTM
jgi:hypothetical protein